MDSGWICTCGLNRISIRFTQYATPQQFNRRRCEGREGVHSIVQRYIGEATGNMIALDEIINLKPVIGNLNQAATWDSDNSVM